MIPSSDLRGYYESRDTAKAVTSDNPHSRELVEIVMHALDIRHTDRVLDVGCSDGYLLERLMDGAKFATGTGVDISELSVQTARSLVRRYANISFCQGYADALPLGNETFDKIICNEVIEHVPDDLGTLKELWRVCAPGGLVYVTGPNSFHDMLPLFVRHCRRVDEMEGHLRRYSAEEFRRLAEAAGFELVRLQYNAFLASYCWYAGVIYNTPLKNALMRVLLRGDATRTAHSGHDALPLERPSFGPLARIGFIAMQLVSALDRPFRSSKRNMGFYAVLAKK